MGVGVGSKMSTFFFSILKKIFISLENKKRGSNEYSLIAKTYIYNFSIYTFNLLTFMIFLFLLREIKCKIKKKNNDLILTSFKHEGNHVNRATDKRDPNLAT